MILSEPAPTDTIDNAPRVSPEQRRIIALLGNPNTGKTTLFNALTGFSRHVANYPGVTVEIARGRLARSNHAIDVLDLPGTYSLAAMSPDEQVVSDLLCGRMPDQRRPGAIIAIVDASNLQRNLYLVSQLLELGLPLIIALNMTDVARQRGIEIDAAELSQRLGVPVVPIIARDDKTIGPLMRAIESMATNTETADCGAPQRAAVRAPLPAAVVREVAALSATSALLPTEALRVLVDVDGHAESCFYAAGGDRARIEAARTRWRDQGLDPAAAEVTARYAWIRGLLDGVVHRSGAAGTSVTQRVDRVMMHPLLGIPILIAVLFLVFQAIFAFATPLMAGIEWTFGRLGQVVGPLLPEGILRSMVTDGIIAGVGGVIVFLPQIMILFALIAVLEDCGYLPRAAFMMDRVMRAAGLSGRSLIPLLSSFACAVPAIMGTRVIADRRERFVTILIAPFMSCSARLPVYALMIGAFVPASAYLGGWVSLRGVVMLAMYLVGVLVALPLAWLLKRTVFRGPPPAFLLELPSYKWPAVRTVWIRVRQSATSFLARAGTVILAVNLVVWALGYLPRSSSTAEHVLARAQLQGWNAEQTQHAVDGAYLRESYLGQMGHLLEPAIRPLGWDWRIGVAVIASFPAREVVVATLSTIFNLGGADDETSQSLSGALATATWLDTGRPLFTLPVALSIMVFFALCAQCASTLTVIGRETRSWRWPIMSFLGMTTLAYLAALAVSKIGVALANF
ncbi:MAG: ferrous iron transport protein B [Phycisphaerae bacterium]